MVEWTFVYSSKFLRFCTSLAFPIGTCFASFRFNAIIDAFTSGICNNRNDPISRRKSSLLPSVDIVVLTTSSVVTCPPSTSYSSSSSIHICFSYLYMLIQHLIVSLKTFFFCHGRGNIQKNPTVCKAV